MLGRALTVEWMSRSIIFLEVAICVAGNHLGIIMWEGAIPVSAYKQGIRVAFTQPVIILQVSFSTISTWPVDLYVWNGPTKNRKIQMSKSKAPMRLFAR